MKAAECTVQIGIASFNASKYDITIVSIQLQEKNKNIFQVRREQ